MQEHLPHLGGDPERTPREAMREHQSLPHAAAFALQRTAGNGAAALFFAAPQVAQRQSQTEGVPRHPTLVRPGDPRPPPHLQRPAGYAGPASTVRSAGPLGPQPTAGTEAAADLILEQIAARFHDNPLHRELTSHYVHGGGHAYHLTVARMRQVLHSGSSRLNILGDPRWTQMQQVIRTLEVEANRSGVASAPVRTSLAGVGCDADLPSLGGFTVHIAGVTTARRGATLPEANVNAIELRSQLRNRLGPPRRGEPAPPIEAVDPNTVYYQFSGTMNWEDDWNFDYHIPDPHGVPQTRTPTAERNTRLAHDWLPGMPFHITSETVPVTQGFGTSAATW